MATSLPQAAPAAGTVEFVADPTAPAALSPRQQVWRRLRRDKAALLGAMALIVLLIVALAGPTVLERWLDRPAESVNANAQDFLRGRTLAPDNWALRPDAPASFRIDKQGNAVSPDVLLKLCNSPKRPANACWYYPLGSDGAVGHDELMWLVKGARTSLVVAFGATIISMFLGVVLGSLAGFLGGIVDSVVSRTIEIIMAFPITLFIIALAAIGREYRNITLGGVFPKGALMVMVVISVFGWYYPARVVRGQVLALREKEFVEAARMLGAPRRRIIFTHILPYLVAPIIVYSTLILAQNVLAEAGLSFLGVGIDPSEPSWGNLLATATQYFKTSPLVMLLPGAALLLLTIATNLLGDGLRDAFDPRSTL